MGARAPVAASVLGLLASLGMAGAAAAQGFEGYIDFSAECSGGTIRLDLTGNDDGRRPDVVGFDIVRQVHGGCDSLVRITASPIARPQSGNFALQFVDSDIANNVMYRYQAFGVDAARTTQVDLATIYVNSEGSDIAYAACGEALAAHGRLTVLGSAWHLETCPASCFPSIEVNTLVPGLDALVGTGVAVRLYGNIASTLQGHRLFPSRFEIRSCGTAVERSSWGDLKELYRTPLQR